jgi:hypothetical protein
MFSSDLEETWRSTYPASMTGWLILNSLVRGVSKICGDEGIL